MNKDQEYLISDEFDDGEVVDMQSFYSNKMNLEQTMLGKMPGMESRETMIWVCQACSETEQVKKEAGKLSFIPPAECGSCGEKKFTLQRPPKVEDEASE